MAFDTKNNYYIQNNFKFSASLRDLAKIIASNNNQSFPTHDERHVLTGHMQNRAGEVLQAVADLVFKTKIKQNLYPDETQCLRQGQTARNHHKKWGLKEGEVTDKDLLKARQDAINTYEQAIQIWGHEPRTYEEFCNMQVPETPSNWLES